MCNIALSMPANAALIEIPNDIGMLALGDFFNYSSYVVIQGIQIWAVKRSEFLGSKHIDVWLFESQFWIKWLVLLKNIWLSGRYNFHPQLRSSERVHTLLVWHFSLFWRTTMASPSLNTISRTWTFARNFIVITSNVWNILDIVSESVIRLILISTVKIFSEKNLICPDAPFFTYNNNSRLQQATRFVLSVSEIICRIFSV